MHQDVLVCLGTLVRIIDVRRVSINALCKGEDGLLELFKARVGKPNVVVDGDLVQAVWAASQRLFQVRGHFFVLLISEVIKAELEKNHRFKLIQLECHVQALARTLVFLQLILTPGQVPAVLDIVLLHHASIRKELRCLLLDFAICSKNC